MKIGPAMNIRVVLLISILALHTSLFARENTDVLVMKNGDRMTCQVKGLEAGVLYVSFDYIEGTASVQWSRVARLESKDTFEPSTLGGINQARCQMERWNPLLDSKDKRMT